MPKVPDAVATVMCDERGQLRPIVRLGSRAAGAALGHATGVPGMEVAGLFAGPSLADALIPAREASVAKPVNIRTSPNFGAAEYKAGCAGLSPNAGLPEGNATPFDS